MLGTRTQGGRMIGTDESTEPWQHPNFYIIRRQIFRYFWKVAFVKIKIGLIRDYRERKLQFAIAAIWMKTRSNDETVSHSKKKFDGRRKIKVWLVEDYRNCCCWCFWPYWCCCWPCWCCCCWTNWCWFSSCCWLWCCCCCSRYLRVRTVVAVGRTGVGA